MKNAKRHEKSVALCGGAALLTLGLRKSET